MKAQERSGFETYIRRAKELEMNDAVLISPEDITFDIRAKLKCRWGCDDFFARSVKCQTRNTSFQERVEMIRAYRTILLLHSHDPFTLSHAALAIEREAFLDGHYFAFALRYCNLCKSCAVDKGDPCPTPEKVRPCDQGFGIDVYNTARNLGLPCEVLRSRADLQNRYGFVLIE